jgi:hypothetical protein
MELADRARLVQILEASVIRESAGTGVELADDGEHVYVETSNDDGRPAAYRYYVSPDHWAQLEAFERGEIAEPRIMLRAPARGAGEHPQ